MRSQLPVGSCVYSQEEHHILTHLYLPAENASSVKGESGALAALDRVHRHEAESLGASLVADDHRRNNDTEPA